MPRDFDAQQAIDDLAYKLGTMSYDDYQAAKRQRQDDGKSNADLFALMASPDRDVAARARSAYLDRSARRGFRAE